MSWKALIPGRVLRVTGANASTIPGDSMLYAVLPAQMAAFGVPNALAARSYERFGFTLPFTTAVILGASTTVAYGLARGFRVLLVARLLWGVSFSLMRLGGYLVVLEESSEADRGRLMGFLGGGHRFGSLVGGVTGRRAL